MTGDVTADEEKNLCSISMGLCKTMENFITKPNAADQIWDEDRA